jgi:hypothetical protein
MIDISKMKALAEKVGAVEWYEAGDSICLPDGDTIACCQSSIGHMPEPIHYDDMVEYLVSVSPAKIIALLSELEAREADRRDAEPQWIVNDLGELGVKVGERFFFLYKGDNIQYGSDESNVRNGAALHDDGTPMQYRIVGKREFGETCLPLSWIIDGQREDRYSVNLVYTPGLSFGKPEDGDWKNLPAALAQRQEGEDDAEA